MLIPPIVLRLEDIVQKGEVWYARLPLSITLDEVRVTDLTEKTIEIQIVGQPQYTSPRRRYKRGTVKFIERKKDG